MDPGDVSKLAIVVETSVVIEIREATEPVRFVRAFVTMC